MTIKLDDIEDASLRKQVALLQLDYWHQCTWAAARVHPNWEVTNEGNLKWLGGRKGPRVPRTLLNWFLANYPDECARIRDRIAAIATHANAMPEVGTALN
jgi:hypothetical protein